MNFNPYLSPYMELNLNCKRADISEENLEKSFSFITQIYLRTPKSLPIKEQVDKLCFIKT